MTIARKKSGPETIILDSNTYSFIVDAWTLKGPSSNGLFSEDVKDEQIALVKIYFHANVLLGTCPAVEAETEKIKDPVRRAAHSDFALVGLACRPMGLKAVEERVSYYGQLHPGEKNQNDCLIVAEAECSGCSTLLTYDTPLLNHLRGKTKSIKLIRPTELWEELAVPKGTPPRLRPLEGNPLEHETWWRHL